MEQDRTRKNKIEQVRTRTNKKEQDREERRGKDSEKGIYLFISLLLIYLFQDSRAIIPIASALGYNITITTLNLGYNLIEKRGCKALGVALRTNTTLTVLDLVSKKKEKRKEKLKEKKKERNKK